MPTAPAPTFLPRLQSLDVFRGITIAAMILVNKQGSSREGYEALQHVPWHGATPTDWIFPFFLFIVGVALPFSIANRQRKGATDGDIMRHALVRGAILFVLGMFEKNFPFTGTDLDTFRIPGVLQRIAFCYIVATFLLVKTTARTQGIVAAVLLVGYWVLLAFVPVPGAGVVALTRENAGINWAAWLDQLTMGRHLGYGNHTWDANGLLSSFPSIVSTQFGIFTAWVLRADHGMRAATSRLAGLGVVTVLAGWLWGGLPPIHGLAIVGEPSLVSALFFPINKLLWTSSFVLWTSGLGMLALAACVWLIDLRSDAGSMPGWTKPFLWLGSNAIFAYLASAIVWKLMGLIRVGGGDDGGQRLAAWLHAQAFAVAIPSPALASLLQSMTFLLVWIAITGLMYRRKVFLKL